MSLMTAREAGKEGQLGNSVGIYLCADLACSLYLRGKRDAGPGGRIHEACRWRRRPRARPRTSARSSNG
ncbi:hypothetical protein GCM10010492_70990 [Saccharothrix mutabilis subsp. mutabilis]|uniref:Elongation factor G-binding protein C-terminal treble-clef zinc-finger domain-containing protein n=1 Tax=Saccharothrix mutabilis subsp. mutabilis TaxID=66855 RepID=A0ABP3EFS2_9PSEU